MKNILIIFALLLSALSVKAQVKQIDISATGEYTVTVEVDRGQYVTVTETGEIVDIKISGGVERYKKSSTIRPELNGKIKNVGIIPFDYYSNRISNSLTGRVRKIGLVLFEYYDDYTTAGRDRRGKLKRVGDAEINYYRGNLGANNDRTGKVSRIGGITFDYYTPGAERPTQADVNKYGLLKRADNYTYDYNAPGKKDERGTINKKTSSPVKFRVGATTVLVTDKLKKYKRKY